MKKRIPSILIAGFAFLFMSCASTMEFNKSSKIDVPDTFQTKRAPELEFIGFKADANNLSTGNGESVKIAGTWTTETYTFPSDFELWKTYKTDSSLKNLGSLLEKSNVAYDKSFSYFGIYSLQELELYKSEKRFVTFVEVNKNHLGGTVKEKWIWPGAILLGTGVGLVSGGAIYVTGDPDNTLGLGKPGKVMIGIGLGTTAVGAALAAIPCETILRFDGEYQIYVYDTKDKKIVYKDVVSVAKKDTYKGSFFHNSTNKYEIYDYYGTLVHNAILKKYTEIQRFIDNYLE